jgi:Ni/Fe-hydrogenase subunit HybB-like protein
VLFSSAKVRRSEKGLFAGAILILLGFVLDRMNVTITGMESSAGMRYVPSWMELSITISIVAFGFVVFSLAAKYLPVFKHEVPMEAKPAPETWIEELVLVSERS